MDDVVDTMFLRMRQFDRDGIGVLDLYDAIHELIEDHQRLRAALQREVMKNARARARDGRELGEDVDQIGG